MCVQKTDIHSEYIYNLRYKYSYTSCIIRHILIVNDYSNKLVQDIFFFVGIDSQIAMMLSS